MTNDIKQNKELEIRALECLGGREVGRGNMVSLPEVVAEIINWDFHMWFDTDKLEFTSSFDWSYLGLLECKNRGYCVTLKIQKDYHYINISTNAKRIKDLKTFASFSTRKKEDFIPMITNAWVIALGAE